MKGFVTDKLNEQWLFYINGHMELCYTKDGKEQILQAGLRRDFDIIAGKGGDLHITAQTDTGSLIHLVYDYESWRKFTVLGSKSAEGVMSGFRLAEVKGELHSFYILDYKGKTMLVHHIYSASGPSPSPKVIDYADKGSEINICADGDGNIHIFFIGVEGKMEYRIYSPTTKGYAEGKINTEDEIRSIFTVFSDVGSMHFLYTARLKSYYALVYLPKDATERKIISFGDSNMADICMSVSGESLCIQWRERGMYYQCISADGGATFKKPTPINQVRGKTLEMIKDVTAHNPQGFGGQWRVAHCKGGEVEFANVIKRENPSHKSRDIAYNNNDGPREAEIALSERISKAEREIMRISTSLQSLTDKVAHLTKGLIPSPAVRQMKVPVTEDVNDSIKAFEDMSIEDVDFSDSKKF